MHPTIAAELANQRHAQLLAEAQEYRRAQAARLPRPGRISAGPARGIRRVFSPVGVFRSWLAAGLL